MCNYIKKELRIKKDYGGGIETERRARQESRQVAIKWKDNKTNGVRKDSQSLKKSSMKIQVETERG